MIVVVTGSRHWAGWPWKDRPEGVRTSGRDIVQANALTAMLTGLQDQCVVNGSVFSVVVGDCKTGADALASHWAARHQAALLVFEANWDKYGRGGGPERNRDMIDWVTEQNDSAIVIACYDGESKGTAHCASYAATHGLQVIELRVVGP